MNYICVFRVNHPSLLMLSCLIAAEVMHSESVTSAKGQHSLKAQTLST